MSKLKKMIKYIVLIIVLCTISATIFLATSYVPSTKETLCDELSERIINGESYVFLNSHNMDVFDIMAPIVHNVNIFNVDIGKMRIFKFGNFLLLYTPNNKYGDVKSCQEQIDTEVEKILNDLNVYNASDFDKTFAVYDWICKNIKYKKLDNCKDQDIYNAIINKETVCAGVSKTFIYLLSKLDIRAEYVAGDLKQSKSDITNHAWVVVYIDNKPYSFDITNDMQQSVGDIRIDTYEYFAITSKEIKKRYTIDKRQSPLSAHCCNSTKYNLFVKNNMIIHEGTIEELIEISKRTNGVFIYQCASDDVFTKALESIRNPDFEIKLWEMFGLDADITIDCSETVNTIRVAVTSESQ